MNNNVKIVCGFILGAAAGAAVSWAILKDKYARIAQEEIDSVKEVYSRKKKILEDAECECLPDENKITVHRMSDSEKEELETIILNYKSDDEEYEEEGGMESMVNDIPYVIHPDEFGIADDYETITLTYYSGDDVLADDNEQVIYDVDDVVGPDALNSFGEYEDDTVYVRNEQRKCDYEICMDDACYYDEV